MDPQVSLRVRTPKAPSPAHPWSLFEWHGQNLDNIVLCSSRAALCDKALEITFGREKWPVFVEFGFFWCSFVIFDLLGGPVFLTMSYIRGHETVLAILYKASR